MNTEELTQVVTAHQMAISRHDQQMAAINATLNRTAQQQELNTQAITQLAAQQQLNAELLHRFEAGMIDLRDQVANFVKSREQPK